MKTRIWTRRMGVIILAIACMGGISGCSLAIEEAGVAGTKDRMVGVFVTDEYLDLFDFDSYLEDHQSELLANENTVVDSSDKYKRKLYGNVEKNGSSNPSDWDITFAEIDGEYCISPLWEDEAGERYRGSECTDGIGELALNAIYNDEGEELELSFTLCILPGQIDQNIAYFANPVYQTETGEFYVLSGEGFSTSGNSSEGVQMTTTLSDETTVTEGKESRTEKTSVTVQYKVMYEPVRITVYQMNGESQIVKKEEYQPGKLPEQIQPEESTEYFLIETEKLDGDGNVHVMRDLYEPDEYGEEMLGTFYPLGNGLLVKQYTEILWEMD